MSRAGCWQESGLMVQQQGACTRKHTPFPRHASPNLPPDAAAVQLGMQLPAPPRPHPRAPFALFVNALRASSSATLTQFRACEVEGRGRRGRKG